MTSGVKHGAFQRLSVALAILVSFGGRADRACAQASTPSSPPPPELSESPAQLSSSVVAGVSSVAINDDGTALFVNPAGIDRSVPWSYFLSWSAEQLGQSNLGAIALTGGPFGIGYQQIRPLGQSRADRLTFALGGATLEPLSAGIRAVRESWRIPGSHPSAWRWDAGLLWRPARFLSVGATANDLNQDRLLIDGPIYHRSYTLGLGVRPLSHAQGSRLTLFADLSGAENQVWKRSSFLLGGIQVEPIPGLELSGGFGGQAGSRERTVQLAISLHSVHGSVSAGLRYDRIPFESGGSGITYQTKLAQAIYSIDGTTARERTAIPEPTLARIDLAGDYGDESQHGLSTPVPFVGAGSNSGIRPVLHQLDLAARDPNVRGVYLELSPVGMGALVSEVRDGIGRVRAEGKPVVAHMNSAFGISQYYLASACDQIVLDPVGDVSGLGFRADILYYGAALDSAGLRFDKIAHGQFKTAGEQLTRSTPSDGETEELNSIIDDLRPKMLDDIAAARKIDRAKLDELANGQMIEAPRALASGLVDSLGGAETARRILDRLASLKNQEPVSIEDWTYREYSWADRPKVAVLWVGGAIEDGESSRGFLSGNTMGAVTVVSQLRALADRGDIKVVVLRVDSPGGSGLASDQIWRAVEEVKKHGKKVIVSMSRLAASGGYYISCGANEIFADPFTITGSIGVLDLRMSAADFYSKHRIGVATLERGNMMGLWTSAVALTPEERAHLQNEMDLFYGHFLDRVAAGRPLQKDDIDEIAQGRIWTGHQAVGLKLIDHSGGPSRGAGAGPRAGRRRSGRQDREHLSAGRRIPGAGVRRRRRRDRAGAGVEGARPGGTRIRDRAPRGHGVILGRTGERGDSGERRDRGDLGVRVLAPAALARAAAAGRRGRRKLRTRSGTEAGEPGHRWSVPDLVIADSTRHFDASGACRNSPTQPFPRGAGALTSSRTEARP